MLARSASSQHATSTPVYWSMLKATSVYVHYAMKCNEM